MIHPLRSIQAHSQTWMANHFEKTGYGQKLAGFKDCHKNRRCFLVGNGPSLRAEDLTLLHEHGEICFAFNRIYNIFDQTQWRPTYYISQDEKMLLGCADIVNRTEMGTKFIPINLKWYHDIHIDRAAWFLMKAPDEQNGKPEQFSDDLPRCLYNSSTGMYTAAQVAAYMGINEIYMIGVDHHFRISQNAQGEIVTDESAKDYFSDKYNEDKDKLYIPNTEKSTWTYVAMKEQCDKRGIRVYNASRQTRLEVFERVDFESIF